MPIGPRCGDKAEYEYEVTSELIGLFASVFVTRENTPGITANSQLEIKKEKTEVVWPDQEKKDGTYYGGRKFDPRGLDKKSYEEKFDEQKFKLDIMCVGEEKGSGDIIEIKAYDSASESFTGPRAKGIPVPIELHRRFPIPGPLGKLGFKTKKIISATAGAQTGVDQDGKRYRIATNCGNYDIEFKDGVATITVKIKLKPKTGSNRPITPDIFQSIKNRAEAFWNSEACGYGQWSYHRTDCVRKDDCSCSVIIANGEVKQAGCCKFPLHLNVEEGADNEVEINFLSLLQKGLKFLTGESLAGANTALLNYPESRANTYAHEIGHMMGFPDQYEGGHTEADAVSPLTGKSSKGGIFPIDSKSIMGAGQTRAKECHFGAEWFQSWINDKAANEQTKPLLKA